MSGEEMERVARGRGEGGEGKEAVQDGPHLAIREVIITILEEMQSNMALGKRDRSQGPTSRGRLDRLGQALEGLCERVHEPVSRKEPDDAHPDGNERVYRRHLSVPLCIADRGAFREPAAPHHARLAMVVVPAPSKSMSALLSTCP